jgi:DNA-binding transcriptional ArsR family regulator
MSEDVIVLEPGDERAQKIGKAISSQTANDILQILSQGSKTASDLTELLNIPMGTLKYHIDNLLEVGLVEIAETRYSIKGREVKVYRLKDQLVIVAPRVTNIRSILLKYASLFVVVILASLVILAILPFFQAPGIPGPAGISSPNGTISGGGEMLTKEAAAPRAEPLSEIHTAAPVLAFFMGGCIVLLLLLLYDVYKWQKYRY